MPRPTLMLAALVLAMTLMPATAPASDVVVEDITFDVANPLEPGATYQVQGSLFRGAADLDCRTGVMLLQHGLSYGRWAWDFPMVTDTEYSVARSLARAGHHVVTVDRLGYGASGHPNGHLLTVEGYAAMTDQMVAHLRGLGYGMVGLLGHSAGTELSEFAQAVYGSADLLVATAYHQFPSDRIVVDFITGDSVRATTHDREYFGADPEQRTEYMYETDFAEPEVVAADNAMANWTPSGEILSIGMQPSRYVLAAIDVPVLLVLAEHDLLFPVERAPEALALFASSPDASTVIVPDAGHSFMLHENAAATTDAMIDWLGARMSAC